MGNAQTAFIEGFFGAIMLFLIIAAILVGLVLIILLIVACFALSVLIAPFALITGIIMHFWPKKLARSLRKKISLVGCRQAV